jgi:hypothetical protein
MKRITPSPSSIALDAVLTLAGWEIPPSSTRNAARVSGIPIFDRSLHTDGVKHGEFSANAKLIVSSKRKIAGNFILGRRFTWGRHHNANLRADVATLHRYASAFAFPIPQNQRHRLQEVLRFLNKSQPRSVLFSTASGSHPVSHIFSAPHFGTQAAS